MLGILGKVFECYTIKVIYCLMYLFIKITEQRFLRGFLENYQHSPEGFIASKKCGLINSNEFLTADPY